jgi:hypothetical protein
MAFFLLTGAGHRSEKLGSMSKRVIVVCAACSQPAQICQDPWREAQVVGAAADAGCGDRTCQQDRQDGMGHDGQGRALQGTCRTHGVNEIAPTSGTM